MRGNIQEFRSIRLLVATSLRPYSRLGTDIQAEELREQPAQESSLARGRNLHLLSAFKDLDILRVRDSDGLKQRHAMRREFSLFRRPLEYERTQQKTSSILRKKKNQLGVERFEPSVHEIRPEPFRSTSIFSLPTVTA